MKKLNMTLVFIFMSLTANVFAGSSGGGNISITSKEKLPVRGGQLTQSNISFRSTPEGGSTGVSGGRSDGGDGNGGYSDGDRGAGGR